MSVPRFGLFAGLFLALVLLGSALTSDAAQAAAPELPDVENFAGRDPLVPGSTGIVRAEGDCLNLRESPGLGGRPATCLREGTTVTILPSVVTIDSLRWQMVNTGQLTGWVADQYLQAHVGVPSAGPA